MWFIFKKFYIKNNYDRTDIIWMMQIKTTFIQVITNNMTLARTWQMEFTNTTYETETLHCAYFFTNNNNNKLFGSCGVY